MKTYPRVFDRIVSPTALFTAWGAFEKDKRNKQDVQAFAMDLEQNIFALHRDLVAKRYKHGPYEGFYINDPKRRHIHKATVRDRVLHHAVFAALNPLFEPTFIARSFSCRVGKGTHAGVTALERILRAVSQNNHKPCFALKCDVQKFFDSVNHDILLDIIAERITDDDALWLITEIIESYNASYPLQMSRNGLPLGNLTSQLFANIYMNVFDQFVKHDLRIKHYVRYTDDFVMVGRNKKELRALIEPITAFLHDRLALRIHPNKIIIRSYHQGIDFLGYVLLPHYRRLRTKTRRRIVHKLNERVQQYQAGIIPHETLQQSIQSYFGVLSHADEHYFFLELLGRYGQYL